MRKRKTEAKETWIYTKPTDKVISEDINIHGFQFLEDLMGEEVNIEKDSEGVIYWQNIEI